MLELGVGTGRIALPVAAAGCEIVGIDLSAEMLAGLRQHLRDEPAARGAPLQLVRGDISRLPFRGASFDAAMATHVLHLVPRWQSTLEQMVALLKPGGQVLLGRDWVDPEGMAGKLRMAFRQAVMARGMGLVAPAGGKAVLDCLLVQGARPERAGPAEFVAAEWTAQASPRQVLDGIRSRDDAESWVLPDEALRAVVAELEAFVAREWPDPDATQSVLRRFLVTTFRKAA